MTDRTDLEAEMARYSWEAYRGLLFADNANGDCAAEATSAGLVYFDDETPWETEKGTRVLARLQELADGLDGSERRALFMIRDGNHMKCRRTSVGQRKARRRLDERGLTTIEASGTTHVCRVVTPTGLAVLWVYDHGSTR